ncbi:MAG: hypothetical protein LH615_02685 [Ferruginibacter sp.]|nr:hypothetical protein [Ferruginibacter sp.]
MQQSEAAISLKDKIHFAISDIEDEKFLESILMIVTDKNKQNGLKLEPDDKILIELNDRRAKYLSGEEKAYSLEEFKAKFYLEHGI